MGQTGGSAKRVKRSVMLPGTKTIRKDFFFCFFCFFNNKKIQAYREPALEKEKECELSGLTAGPKETFEQVKRTPRYSG